MKSGRIESWLLGMIIILAIKVFFFPPYDLQLRSEEPRRAVISMEMIYSDNYLEPQIHGWSYYNKPPLFNWIMVFFMQLFNSFDEWTVRLPGLLSHAILAFCVYKVSKRYLGKEAAILSALFYLTAGEILFYGSVIAGQIDLFYALLVFLQLTFLYSGMDRNQKSHLFLSYVFLALGVLTKGIPSIAFQILTILGWYFSEAKFKRKFSILNHGIGGSLAVFIVGIYFYLYHQQGGHSGIYLINLFYEASQKSALETEGSKLLKNILAFPGVFLKLLLPWVLLFSLLHVEALRREVWRNHLTRFASIVIIANIFLYWAAEYITTRYLFPFVPFMAIITAQVTCQAVSLEREKLVEYFYKFIQLLVIAAPIGILVYILSEKGTSITYPWLKFAISVLVSALVITAFTKWRKKRLLLSILFVLILKQYSHWTYYPTRYADERVNSLIAQVPVLFSYTKGGPIYLLGYPEKHHIDVSLGQWSVIDTTFEDAMPLSYQLPYYIERNQKQIMQFHTKPERGRFYLVRKEDMMDLVEMEQIEVLYEFIDDWKRIPLALIKT